jgi:hypothetical protein
VIWDLKNSPRRTDSRLFPAISTRRASKSSTRDVTTELAAARQQAAIERERLVRLMGLWGSDLDFKLPSSLPGLPTKPRTQPTIEQDAMDHRVDLQIARIEVEALARFINVLDASGISKTQKDKGSGRPHSDGGGFGVRSGHRLAESCGDDGLQYLDPQRAGLSRHRRHAGAAQ